MAAVCPLLLAAGGVGFWLGHTHTLSFLWEALSQLPSASHKGGVVLGLALILGAYVCLLLLLLPCSERTQSKTPPGVPRTCADEQMRRRGSFSF